MVNAAAQRLGFLGVGLFLGLIAASSAPAADTQATGEDIEFFEKKIRPVLVENCYKCHGNDPQKIKGGFVLIHRQGLRIGGDSGPAIVPGDPESSRLIEAIRYENENLQMPPDGKLPDQAIADLIEWVSRGAPDPREAGPQALAAPNAAAKEYDYTEGRKHWAYHAIADPAPPVVANEAWVSSDIDRFILAKLEENQLPPAAPADKRTLLRRTTFDLIGLPPTPQEIEDFLADESPSAFAKVVDRLLGSPRYGERWGRHWLDVVRYADSNGLDENIGFPNAWRYRDYVINALNKDKPYNRFITEQLAGDLMPYESGDQRAEQLTATGFLVVGAKVLAEPDSEKMNYDIVDEQIGVLGKAFLAQTLDCARCHDHKFDPIPAYDYYAMVGILKSTEAMTSYDRVAKWRERELADDETIAQRKLYEKDLADAQSALNQLLDERNEVIQSEWRGDLSKYLLAATALAQDIEVREAEEFHDSNLLVDDSTFGDDIGVLYSPDDRKKQMSFVEWKVYVPMAGKYRIDLRYASHEKRPVILRVNGRRVSRRAANLQTARRQRNVGPETQEWDELGIYEFEAGENTVRLESRKAFPYIDQYAIVPADENSPYIIKAEQIAEEFDIALDVVEQWIIHQRVSRRTQDPIFAIWHAYTDLQRQRPFGFGEASAVLAEELHALAAEDERAVQPLTVSVLTGLPPTSLQELAGRYQTLFTTVQMAYEQHLLRLESRTDEFENERQLQRAQRLPDAQQEKLRQVLYGQRSPFVVPSGDQFYDEPTRRQLAQLREAVEQLEASAPPALPTAMAVDEGQITDMPIHIRGDHTNVSMGRVPRGFMRVTDHVVEPQQLPDKQSGRLELAAWITDPDHPLTTRVMVNRIWQGHFGIGLVGSPNNFGTRGEQPTHPELLDYLAKRFVEDGWSIKAMHRRIMLTSAYQMSSAYNSQAAELDPDNRLLWRMSRRRLEAEPLRDALMAMGDNLDLTMGGGLFPTRSGYVRTTDAALISAYASARRAVYMPIIRTAIYPMFASFDYSDPNVPIGRRPSTVIAPQALFMMNSPLVVRQAKLFADSVLGGPEPDDPARIETAYVKAYARPPQPAEVARAVEYLDQMRQRYTPPAEDTTSEESAGDDEPDPVELFAWQNLCHVIMASSEFLYVN